MSSDPRFSLPSRPRHFPLHPLPSKPIAGVVAPVRIFEATLGHHVSWRPLWLGGIGRGQSEHGEVGGPRFAGLGLADNGECAIIPGDCNRYAGLAVAFFVQNFYEDMMTTL